MPTSYVDGPLCRLDFVAISRLNFVWDYYFHTNMGHSSFFLNWCNASPSLMAKSNHLWMRGSLIPNPFLRVLSISGFLKVIHAPKTPQKRCESGTSKINFLYSVFKILVIGTFHEPYKPFWQLTLDMGVFIRFMGSPDCKDLKNAMGEVNFLGTWFTPLFGGFGGVDDL